MKSLTVFGSTMVLTTEVVWKGANTELAAWMNSMTDRWFQEIDTPAQGDSRTIIFYRMVDLVAPNGIEIDTDVIVPQPDIQL